MSVRAEDILFRAREVRVNTTGEECVFGYIGVSGVLVEWQEEKPRYADEDAKDREERENLKDPC